MKLWIVLFTLIMVTSCGAKKKSSNEDQIFLPITTPCVVSDVAPQAPTLKIDQAVVDNVLANLADRPFERDSFWRRLERQTRLRLNLALNKQMKDFQEDFLYKGVVLFFENLVKNPEQSFYFKTKARSVVFYTTAGSLKVTGGSCENQDRNIEAIDLSKVIPESTLEKKLNCYGPHMHVELSLYKDAVVVSKLFDVYSFSGGELIWNVLNGETRLEGLAPDQSTLRATISPGKVLVISLMGTSGSIVGTGMCD